MTKKSAGLPPVPTRTPEDEIRALAGSIKILIDQLVRLALALPKPRR